MFTWIQGNEAFRRCHGDAVPSTREDGVTLPDRDAILLFRTPWKVRFKGSCSHGGDLYALTGSRRSAEGRGTSGREYRIGPFAIARIGHRLKRFIEWPRWRSSERCRVILTTITGRRFLRAHPIGPRHGLVDRIEVCRFALLLMASRADWRTREVFEVLLAVLGLAGVAFGSAGCTFYAAGCHTTIYYIAVGSGIFWRGRGCRGWREPRVLLYVATFASLAWLVIEQHGLLPRNLDISP